MLFIRDFSKTQNIEKSKVKAWKKIHQANSNKKEDSSFPCLEI